MADINTVISGIVQVQNRTIMSLTYNNNVLSDYGRNIAAISGDLSELSSYVLNLDPTLGPGTSINPDRPSYPIFDPSNLDEISANLSSIYYTQDEIDHKLRNLTVDGVDFSQFSTRDETSDMIDISIDTLSGALSETYYNRSQMDQILKYRIDDQNFLRIDNLANYCLKSELNEAKDDLASFKSNVYTKSQVDAKLANAGGNGGVVSFENYYTKNEIDNSFYSISVLNSLFYTKSESSSLFYSKEQIDGNFYTKTEVDSLISNFNQGGNSPTPSTPTVDLSNYYTKADINDNYYTKSDINDNYYTKSNITENYYTKTEVDNLISTNTQPGTGSQPGSGSSSNISISVNGKPQTSNSDGIIDIKVNETDTLLFKIPLFDDNYTCFFEITFSQNDQFPEETSKKYSTYDSLHYVKNSDDSIKYIRIFSGQEMKPLFQSGISYLFSNEQLMIENISELLGSTSWTEYPYYRFQWLLKDTTDEIVYGRYGFGKISGIQSIFDDFEHLKYYTKTEVDEKINALKEQLTALINQA